MYHLELLNNLQLSILRVPGGDSGCTHDAGYNRYSELYPVNYSSPVSIYWRCKSCKVSPRILHIVWWFPVVLLVPRIALQSVSPDPGSSLFPICSVALKKILGSFVHSSLTCLKILCNSVVYFGS